MILVIGKSGQLAQGLQALTASRQLDATFWGRNDVDICDAEALLEAVQNLVPSIIINASAYTAVDKAETEHDEAFAINRGAVENIALAAKAVNAHLVHVSTDYVFAGDKGAPYLPDDALGATGVYGASKAAGEQAINNIYPQASCILRTSWVYSIYGNNFVKTMLRLMAEKPELGVIDDQIGSPTSVTTLAQVCLDAALQQVTGIHHVSDEGVASWYDFACAIQELALGLGMLKQPIPIKPIPSSAYPTPATRPHYSVMSKLSLKQAMPSLTLPHWRQSLSAVLIRLHQSSDS